VRLADGLVCLLFVYVADVIKYIAHTMAVKPK